MPAQLKASDLVQAYGFTAKHWIRLAAAGRIPGARQPTGARGHWLFDAAVFKSYARQTGLVLSEPISLARPPRKPLRKSQPSDCVYVLYSVGHIKFGVSCNVTRRKHGFTTASPAPVTLLAKIAGSNDLEVMIHRRFDQDRSKGEWFLLTPSVRAFVLECQRDGEPFISLESAEAEFRAWLAKLLSMHPGLRP